MCVLDITCRGQRVSVQVTLLFLLVVQHFLLPVATYDSVIHQTCVIFKKAACTVPAYIFHLHFEFAFEHFVLTMIQSIR